MLLRAVGQGERRRGDGPRMPAEQGPHSQFLALRLASPTPQSMRGQRCVCVGTGWWPACSCSLWQLNLGSVIDDMNEKVGVASHVDPAAKLTDMIALQHAEAIAALLAGAPPPITDSPRSCFLNTADVAQRCIALDGSKAQRILAWRPEETLSKETVDETIAVRASAMGMCPESMLTRSPASVIQKGWHMG